MVGNGQHKFPLNDTFKHVMQTDQLICNIKLINQSKVKQYNKNLIEKRILL